MSDFLKGLLSGAAAMKFGGGCLGTLFIILLIWLVLG